MKRTPALDDVALFLAVADAGGLAGAVARTGTSAPTLSRRMTELERVLGRRLFQRGPRGYALTAAGREFLAAAEPLRDAAARLAEHTRDTTRPARVRITAGLWTSRFLARHIRRVWSENAAWIPEFLASNATLDIARREADIGLRNRRPEQPWLAGRRTRPIAYAAYARDPGIAGYIALAEQASTPSDRWLRATHDAEIVTTASDPRLALDLAHAGLGRIILPTFAGDTEPGLVRAGPPIDAIAHDEWLVAHHDGRHDPPVRQALDALGRLLADKALRPEAKPLKTGA